MSASTLVRRVLVAVLSVPIHLHRATALVRSPRCRFHPSCSTYALEALRVHGPVRGSLLAARRLGRCHPWNTGGIDHVPPDRTASTARTTPRRDDRPSTSTTQGVARA